MKILLINANPVVGKLVTLSAQKTGDELISVSSIDGLAADTYDLVMMDDNSYTQELFEELKSHISFSQSCFIGSRNSVKPEAFSREFNKPFLPTDLVDIFMEISSSINSDAVEPGTDTLMRATDAREEEPAFIAKPDVTEDEFDFDALDVLMEESEDDENDELLLLDDALEDLEDMDESHDDEEPIESRDVYKSVLDEDDVKEVQELLDETEEENADEESDDLEGQTPSYSADEKTLDEINAVLNDIDEESEDTFSMDDTPDELNAEEENADLDMTDLEEDLDDEAPAMAEEPREDETMISEEIPEALDEDFATQTEALESIDELTDLDEEEVEDEPGDLLEMDEAIMPSAESLEETIIEEENISDEELAKMLDAMQKETENDANTALADDELLESFDELDELDESEEDFAALDDEVEQKSADIETDAPDESEENFTVLDDELDALDALDEIDESTIAQEEPDEESLPDTLEEESEEEIDLASLNDEIEAALDALDEDDLLSEVDEGALEGFENDFSSISAKDLKLALGEEVLEEEEDEKELDLHDELDALEFMDEDFDEEEEPELIVGQSEFASLHEEALSEAMGEHDESESDHPELDEVDAFVDQISVGGAASQAVSAAGDESVAALERLIATLKQDNVKEALKGMDMNITISFSEKML